MLITVQKAKHGLADAVIPRCVGQGLGARWYHSSGLCLVVVAGMYSLFRQDVDL